jgi:hypothetical protein
VGAHRFVIRATRERGVGVPSSRSLATATREAKSVYGGCLRMGMAPSTDSGIVAEMDARSKPGLKDPFEEAIDDALSFLPADLRAAMSNVEIVVEDEPPDGRPLLGLYRGVPLPRRSSTYSGVLPDNHSGNNCHLRGHRRHDMGYRPAGRWAGVEYGCPTPSQADEWFRERREALNPPQSQQPRASNSARHCLPIHPCGFRSAPLILGRHFDAVLRL